MKETSTLVPAIEDQEAAAIHSRPASASVPVLLVARELGFGGIERDVSKFARYLGVYGISPHVACFNPSGVRWREIESAGVPVVAVPFHSFRSPSVISGFTVLRDYIKQHNIRVVHAFDIPADVYSVPIARLLGVPVAISSQLCYRELSPMAIRFMLGVVDRLASAIFVNCEAIADHLIRDWHVPRNRIEVCYNGFEPAEFHPNFRSRPKYLSNAGVLIGTVALLREEKNLSVLIDAFKLVSDKNPSARLLIVGDGVEKMPLQDQARSLGIEHRCIFEGATDEPAKWMRAIDIFVLTSRSEAFPNSLLEAMACGCCVVASRVGGTPELVSDGENGFLFESGNSAQLAELLSALTQDADLRRRIAAAAAQHVERSLTIEIAAKRLADIYRKLLTQRRIDLAAADQA